MEFSFLLVQLVGPAIRTLVDLGMIELVGKWAKVPYWQCLALDQTHPIAGKTIPENTVIITTNSKTLQIPQIQTKDNSTRFVNQTLDDKDFSKQDLASSRFVNASLVNVNFSEATLDGATWVDGRVCATNSIGVCK